MCLWVHNFKNAAQECKMGNQGGVEGAYENTVYFPLSFSMNLKLLKKIKSVHFFKRQNPSFLNGQKIHELRLLKGR